MAKKISQLTQATQVKSDDVTVIVQDGETKKLPLNTLVTKQDIENKKVAGLAKLDEIEATYENDTYTPTITVKNKSSVKTGEGDEVDYSANVMDGHAKSAILSGNTEVIIGKNLFNGNLENGAYSQFTGVKKEEADALRSVDFIKVEPSSTICCSNNGIARATHIFEYDENKKFLKFNNAVTKLILSSSTKYVTFYGGNSDRDKMQIEYGEEPTYYEEYKQTLTSVKTPVLKTFNNIVDFSNEKLEFEYGIYLGQGSNGSDWVNNKGIASSFVYTLNYIELLPNQTSLTMYGNDTIIDRVVWFDENKKQIGSIVGVNNRTLNIPTGAKYFRFLLSDSRFSEDKELAKDNIGHYNIYYGGENQIFNNEPHKSNILTVNEEVTLRGIGDVRDELDCLTGEVTERIGCEYFKTLNWSKYTYNESERVGYTQFIGQLPLLPETTKALFDMLPTLNYISDDTKSNGMLFEAKWNTTRFRVSISNDLLSTTDVDGLLKLIGDSVYLITKDKESIKTVDLMPSGTHPSTTPYCWKNGHIQLSSSGLLPNLEYSVVTSRAGQINQNATMIVKNDKRIFDLEILLAGGLVNTTYQALTLQNQVETGLSKVSLNSETEPDYLLYHMIMKLIEEKAYKLDDLTEKVSVFYLYEKLSDEQFETIYSALYPFVEDEIVEEPVVEELPEVVEDEVIM